MSALGTGRGVSFLPPAHLLWTDKRHQDPIGSIRPASLGENLGVDIPGHHLPRTLPSSEPVSPPSRMLAGPAIVVKAMVSQATLGLLPKLVAFDL